jgi:hypothetical protein
MRRCAFFLTSGLTLVAVSAMAQFTNFYKIAEIAAGVFYEGAVFWGSDFMLFIEFQGSGDFSPRVYFFVSQNWDTV